MPENPFDLRLLPNKWKKRPIDLEFAIRCDRYDHGTAQIRRTKASSSAIRFRSRFRSACSDQGSDGSFFFFDPAPIIFVILHQWILPLLYVEHPYLVTGHPRHQAMEAHE